MSQIEILVREFFSIDRLTADTGSVSEVTALSHELWNDSVELRCLVMKWLSTLSFSFIACAESSEVLSGLWHGVTEEAEDDTSSFLSINLNIKEHFTGNSGQWSVCGNAGNQCGTDQTNLFEHFYK